MIKSFSIENYRGIKSYEVNNVTQITLLTGKNNSGKSSVLEALFWHHLFNNPNVFSYLSAIRGNTIEMGYHIWEPLFYNNQKEIPITIKVTDEKSLISNLVCKKDISFAPTFDTTDSSGYSSGQAIGKLDNVFSLKYDYTYGNYRESGLFNSTATGIIVENIKQKNIDKRIKLPEVVHMTSATPRQAQEVLEWLGKLELNDNKQMALDVIRLIEPNIRDIFSATQNGVSQIYLKGNDGIVPLKYAGDGTIRLLYIMASMAIHRGGIILIDEIENGFHYSMYSKLIDSLMNAAKENRCQIIATTHNYELISEGLHGLKDNNCNDFSIHRIDHVNGNHSDKYYSYDLINMAIESNMEVR